MSLIPRPFSRSTLLGACAILQIIGHSSFDRFLLEIGIDEIDAGREKGGLLDRSNALGKYAVSNPDALTADGEPLALAIVRKAAIADPFYPDGNVRGIDERERRMFWDGLRKDGYSFDGEEILYPGPGRAPAKTTTSANLEQRSKTVAAALFPKETIMPADVSNKVFLVHGRDESARESVELYLRKLGLDVIVLHDRPHRGRTLIKKFEEEAEGSSFAVVLITPDDEGGAKGSGAQQARGRQNVIFELGFFIGKLGPQNVCALVVEGVEKPSDIDGVGYVDYGPTTKWRNDLARELREAGVPFDHSKVF